MFLNWIFKSKEETESTEKDSSDKKQDDGSLKESAESNDDSKPPEENSEKVSKPGHWFVGIFGTWFLVGVAVYLITVDQVKDASDDVKPDEEVKPDDKMKATEDQDKMEATDGKYSGDHTSLIHIVTLVF